ncbi:MAG: polyprenyl synthetase family protein, partial [Spirochaetales bacterium]|nr:polyprenyl synthetase family protein [Spirochaetales bacterium]
LGILFQLKDDEIGLFGREEETGKPVGSDIREGKKTLFYHYLFSACGVDDAKRLRGIFGNQDSSAEDIDYALRLMEETGARKKVAEKSSALAASSEAMIGDLDGADGTYWSLLQELVDYNMNRIR